MSRRSLMDFTDEELRVQLDKEMEHLGGWSYAAVAGEINRRAAERQTQQSLEVGSEVRDLTREVRDLTRHLRSLTWVTVGVGVVALIVGVIALQT